MDIRTVVICLATCSALSAVLIFLLHWKGYRAPGVSLWAWGQGAFAIGWLLFACRDFLPPVLTVFVANLFRAAGLVFLLQGFRLFLGKGLLPLRSPLWAGGGLLVLSWAWFFFVHPSMPMRYILITFLHAFGRAVIAGQLLTGGRRGKRTFAHFLGAVYLFMALLIFLRSFAEIWVFDSADILSQGLLTALHGLLLILEVMTVTVGLTLMVAEHLQGRVETLENILPICAYCKKIRAEDGSWAGVESYLAAQGGPRLSHGVCPDCEDHLRQDLEG